MLADKGELPEGLAASAVTPVTSIDYALPMWEESDLERPDEARLVENVLSVWRVAGT